MRAASCQLKLLAGGVLTSVLAILFSGCNLTVAALNTAPDNGPPGPPPIAVLSCSSSKVFPLNYLSQSVPVTLSCTVSGKVSRFACTFSGLIGGSMQSATDCSKLPGTVTFTTTSSPTLTWTPDFLASGPYQITVSAINDGGSGLGTMLVDVRAPYGLTNLVADYDASFANLSTAITGSATSWADLTGGGHTGTISNATNDGSTSGWVGNGNSSNPFSLATNATLGAVDFGSTIVPAAQDTLLATAWLLHGATAPSGSIILGDGADSATGKGFALRESETSARRLEFQVGRKFYSELIVADAPAAYYRLDETGTTMGDSSGNGLDGSYTFAPAGNQNSTGLLTGDSNGAYALTGNNATAFVQYGTAPNPGNTISVELWAKPSTGSVASAGLIGTIDGGGVQPGWGIQRFGATTSVELRVDTSGGFNQTYSLSGWDDSTHHMVLVLDNGNLYYYLDGVLKTLGVTYAAGAGFATGARDIFIGCQGTNICGYVGTIDEVAIYTYALNAAQISAHYDAGKGLFYPNNVLSWKPSSFWRLDEPSGLLAHDLSPNANDGIYSTSATLGAAGAFSTDADAAASLSGGASTSILSVIDRGNVAYQHEARTFSAWIYPTAFTGAFVAEGEGDVAHGVQQFELMVDTVAATTTLFTDAINAGNDITIAGAEIPTVNTWSHVAFTIDDNDNWNYYLNGSATKNGTFGTAIFTQAQNIRIGNRTDFSATDAPWSGSVDDVAVFNYALNAQQIAELYSAGAFWKCLSQTALSSSSWLFAGVQWDGTTASLFANGRKECAVQPGVTTTFTNPSSALQLGLSALGSAFAWIGRIANLHIYTQPDGSGAAADIATNWSVEVPRLGATSQGSIVRSGLVLDVDAADANAGLGAYANGCGNDQTVWFDLSNTLFDGTLQGFNLTACTTDGWLGSGSTADPYRLTFDGTNDSVQFGAPTLSTSGTIEVWLRPDTVVGNMNIFVQTDGMAIDAGAVSINNTSGESGSLWVWDGTVPRRLASDATLVAGQWKQLVFVYKAAGTLQLYVNGLAQLPPVNATFDFNGRKFGLSEAVNVVRSGDYFSGSMAAVRVYNRALSQSEISTNCNALASRFGVTCN